MRRYGPPTKPVNNLVYNQRQLPLTPGKLTGFIIERAQRCGSSRCHLVSEHTRLCDLPAVLGLSPDAAQKLHELLLAHLTDENTKDLPDRMKTDGKGTHLFSLSLTVAVVATAVFLRDNPPP